MSDEEKSKNRGDQCLVCKCQGKRMALNYGALSCQKCKSFFFRNYKRDICKIANCRAPNCKGCKVALCLKAGMKPEYRRENGKRGGRRPKENTELAELQKFASLRNQITMEVSQLLESNKKLKLVLQWRVETFKLMARHNEKQCRFQEALDDYKWISIFEPDDLDVQRKIERTKEIVADLAEFKMNVTELIRNEKSREAIFDRMLNLSNRLIEKYEKEKTVKEAVLKQIIEIYSRPSERETERVIQLIKEHLKTSESDETNKAWFYSSLADLESRRRSYDKAIENDEESMLQSTFTLRDSGPDVKLEEDENSDEQSYTTDTSFEYNILDAPIFIKEESIDID